MRKAQIIGIMIFLLIGAIIGLYYYAARPYSSSEIRISTNPWVGFTPLIYAQEKGWLEGTPFRFVWLVDLTENARLYERGFTQGFTATQYEWLQFATRERIKPVFLIDRSDGADVILSNRTLGELRTSGMPVKVYLERGSMNEDFFNAFVEAYRLEGVGFDRVDASQKNIAAMEMEDGAALIVSYAPYVSEIIKKGYRPVASTRTMKNFYVVDALFVDENVLRGREKAFVRLKELFALGVERFRKDPQEYYETIRGYLEGQSYGEFMASMQQIEWLYDEVPGEVRVYLEKQQVKTDRLLP
jgi:NitT/TauT family transport system substrate-binding protein